MPTTGSYVYALGRIEPRFPRLSVEKEFAQATGRAETVNVTDRQALRQVFEADQTVDDFSGCGQHHNTDIAGSRRRGARVSPSSPGMLISRMTRLADFS